MTCRCGKKAAFLAFCTECWIRMTNYHYYVEAKAQGTWVDLNTPTEPPPPPQRARACMP